MSKEETERWDREEKEDVAQMVEGEEMQGEKNWK